MGSERISIISINTRVFCDPMVSLEEGITKEPNPIITTHQMLLIIRI